MPGKSRSEIYKENLPEGVDVVCSYDDMGNERVKISNYDSRKKVAIKNRIERVSSEIEPNSNVEVWFESK